MLYYSCISLTYSYFSDTHLWLMTESFINYNKHLLWKQFLLWNAVNCPMMFSSTMVNVDDVWDTNTRFYTLLMSSLTSQHVPETSRGENSTFHSGKLYSTSTFLSEIYQDNSLCASATIVCAPLQWPLTSDPKPQVHACVLLKLGKQQNQWKCCFWH